MAAPEPRKTKLVVDKKERGKAVVVYSKSSRRKRDTEKPEFPQLDDVPRKKRKLMEASSVVASRMYAFIF